MNYIERYWRDARLEDAIKRPPMVARFRIDEKDVWSVDTLQGLDRSASFRWIGQHVQGKECQVYDAPDPGEGWRLIDVDSETPQHGDEFFAQSSKVWCFCNDVTRMTGYSKGSIIRRRITPTVTYVPFTWEDRDQLRGRWVCCVDAPKKEWAINSVYIGGGGELRANGVPADLLLKQWTFLDTGEPVGRKVTQ